MIKNFNKRFLKISMIFLLSITSCQTFSLEFPVPSPNNNMIGEVKREKAHFGDSTVSVSSRYNLGLNAVMAANPGTTDTTLSTKDLVIPTAFILPPTARKGIIINLPEMRLYYYPENGDKVITYPIGIGKVGNTIPIQNSVVIRKKLNPSWMPGEDARRWNVQQGVYLPRVLPPGPDNPLGPYAIYLDIPSFLLHSAIHPESIGRRASFGCIRMNESDIRDIFPIVTPGTEVQILNMPNKVGWQNNKLYLEAHPMLDEHKVSTKENLADIVMAIQNNLPKNSKALIDWQLVAHLASEPDGVPHEIGMKIIS